MENRMLIRMVTIIFIFICTTVAWGILGATVTDRTDKQDQKLRSEVGQLWGTPQHQLAPQIYFQTTQPVKVETVSGGKTVTETKIEKINHPMLLDASDINVDLSIDY